MAQFRLEIITPEKQFFNGDCESLVIDTPNGKLGVLAHHTPMVAALVKGKIELKSNGSWKTCFCSEGFVEVRPDGTIINAQIVEWPEEMEARLAEDEHNKAEEQLRQEQNLREYQESRISLARAMVKLRVKRSINHS